MAEDFRNYKGNRNNKVLANGGGQGCFSKEKAEAILRSG
jgi:hypothetical protein